MVCHRHGKLMFTQENTTHIMCVICDLLSLRAFLVGLHYWRHNFWKNPILGFLSNGYATHYMVKKRVFWNESSEILKCCKILEKNSCTDQVPPLFVFSGTSSFSSQDVMESPMQLTHIDPSSNNDPNTSISKPPSESIPGFWYASQGPVSVLRDHISVYRAAGSFESPS